jgi:uroporphyrinogen-III synthase
MSFGKAGGNARVLAFESRRAKEIAELIRGQGGEPFVAPALIEVPLAANTDAYQFADRLYAGDFDMVIFLTGVGARLLQRVLSEREPPEKLPAALRHVAVVTRGPKPSAVMREWQVPIAVLVPEPNTWRELLEAVVDRPEKLVAVQEYGRSNPDLLNGLKAQGRTVARVPVYSWALPPDTAPLASALDQLLAGEFRVVCFTTGVQIEHFLDFAAEQGKREAAVEALQGLFLASIGPTCSESLRACGLTPAMEPSHPKMGILIREAAGRYGATV